METIRVNMTPCEDIKTIHASQNDNEAREWGFELHNNGDVIDSSEITDQMVFKAYKGGTEEILPVNGSTPTTSPFKGDIKYPQGLRAQEFLYRQSPAEEDGLAKITDIKGNTLVWNQLQPNNISRTNAGITYTYNNGKLTVTGTATSTSWWLYAGVSVMNMKANHKYLIVLGNSMADSSQTTYNWYLPNSGHRFYTDKTIIAINNDVDQYLQLQISSGYTINTDFYPQVFDLTQIFGAGKEPSTVDEFVSLFGNLFYAYNTGTLLSFNGTGLKTTGKNLLDPSSKTTYDGENGLRWHQLQGFKLKANKTYTFSASNTGDLSVTVYIIDPATRTPLASSSLVTTYTPTHDVIVYFQAYRSSGIPSETEFQLEIGSQTAYEPYTSHTTNLPISTYFPTGMKSAGSVYDELTETKAITRVGSVDLGTLDWSLSSSSTHIFRGKLTDTNAKIPNASNLPNALLANYQPKAYNPISANDNGYFAIGYRSYDDVDVIVIIDSNYSTQDSFISHISGQYLYYELATPTETSFTTASLVTENAEIPLSNEDGVLIGKCTEELSSNSGFFDAKIKLADEDGECYSNKIQLHIERSPQ